MKPRRRPLLSGYLFAHPWYCPGCRRTIPEHLTVRRRDGFFTLFFCPYCDGPLGARSIF